MYLPIFISIIFKVFFLTFGYKIKYICITFDSIYLSFFSFKFLILEIKVHIIFHLLIEQTTACNNNTKTFLTQINLEFRNILISTNEYQFLFNLKPVHRMHSECKENYPFWCRSIWNWWRLARQVEGNHCYFSLIEAILGALINQF